MLIVTVDHIGYLKVGDSIKIRNYCLPPCPPGRTPVHSTFMNYIEQVENLFTVRLIYAFPVTMIATQEINKALLEISQIERVLKGKRSFLVLNCHGRR